MPFNILSAIRNIADFGNNDLKSYSSTYLIRINAVGEQLEFFVKDAICGSFELPQLEKETKYRQVFSLLGNQNNPPDAIIRGGDAFETKKMESMAGSIALNSSPPKDRLYRDDTRLTEACRKCEGGNWNTKDMFYVIGCTTSSKVRYLFFVHGRCYSAERDVYESIAIQLKKGIGNSIKESGIEGSSETVELGRINRVDPLGITNFRIRGMWMIENPIRVFSYVHPVDSRRVFSLAVLMLKTKFDSFPIEDTDAIRDDERIESRTVKVKNPNNPAEMLDSELITLGW